MCRQVSSWVGDHQRIPAVDCFALFAAESSFTTALFCYRCWKAHVWNCLLTICVQRLQQITDKSSSPATARNTLVKPPEHSHLRVTVTSGGCHGFQYLMSLEAASKIDPEEDTIFVAEEDTGAGKAEVVMDSASLELLKGSTIDFTTELIGSQFKIVGNPRAKSSCGCGTSFDIE